MPTMQTGCLYTTIKNTSGRRKIFSFLPPHGMTLDAEEERSFMEFMSTLGADAGADAGSRARALKAFEDAVAAGDLQIVATPAVILVDQDNDDIVTIAVDDGVVTSAPACFTESDTPGP